MPLPERLVEPGTAYRTNIPAGVDSPGPSSVYAVWPPARFRSGTAHTTFVLVDTWPGVDTSVYPCDRSGKILAPEVLGTASTSIHRDALRAASYELEVFAYVRH